MKKDKVFNQKIDSILPFEFNENVANVFDDMINRSVPFYAEIHGIILDILRRTYKSELPIVDLGCSTGTTICLISEYLRGIEKSVEFIGVDNSEAMVAKAEAKFKEKGIKNVKIECTDIKDFKIPPSEFIIMNYTLQFLSKDSRPRLLKNIYDSLCLGGSFILAEKIRSDEPEIQDLTTNLYHDFKRRNGYSELEISQKREALENVLVPLTPDEQLTALSEAGFHKAEIIFRWYNFCCYLCKK